MELKANNGMVEFIFITGNDKVRNRMTESEAKGLISTGNIQKKGNQIIVNGKFIFDLDSDVQEAPEEVQEEVQEVPEEDKPLKEAVKGDKITKKPRKKAKK